MTLRQAKKLKPGDLVLWGERLAKVVTVIRHSNKHILVGLEDADSPGRRWYSEREPLSLPTADSHSAAPEEK